MTSFFSQLGLYPSRKYNRSWITQRILNRIPPEELARRSPVALAQQLINPVALVIQKTYQDLTHELHNSFLSTADLNLLDHLYYIDLPDSFEFSTAASGNGTDTLYVPPEVTVKFSQYGSTYEITLAENNDIETLAYDCLPSRIGYDIDIAVRYSPVFPRAKIEDSFNAANELEVGSKQQYLPVPGHLYITVRDNTTFKTEYMNTYYFPQIILQGESRQGKDITEIVPIKYNGTFKTINQWSRLESVEVRHIDRSAYLTIESFPFDHDGLLDLENVYVDQNQEKLLFNKLDSSDSCLIGECFVAKNLEDMYAGQIFDKEEKIRVLLKKEIGSTVPNPRAFAYKNNSRYIFVIDEDAKLYMYDRYIEYPDLTNFDNGDSDALVELYVDNWIQGVGETFTIKTRNKDIREIPYKYRWHLHSGGSEYYVGKDGSLWSTTTTDGWIANEGWDLGVWYIDNLPLTPPDPEESILTLECHYFNETTRQTTNKRTQILLYEPSFVPEVEFQLPSGFRDANGLGFDSDGKLWVYVNNIFIYEIKLYYDYFLVDYNSKRIWTKEEYHTVSVEAV